MVNGYKNSFLLAAMVFAGLSITSVPADAYSSLSEAVSSPDKTKDYRNYYDQTLTAPLGDLQGNILTVESYYGGDYGQKFYYNGFAYNGGGYGGINVADGQYFSAALAKYIGFSKAMDGVSKGGVINNAGNTSFVGWFGDGRNKYQYNHASLGGSIYNANTGIMTMDKYTDITTYTGSEVLEFWGGNERNQSEIDANAMYGGAIYNAGKMYIVQDRNLDTDYSSSNVNISEIQFEGNGASVKGGAIYNAAGAEFTLYGTNRTRILFADSKPNVVASNNAADGGAIYNDGGVINLGVDDSQYGYIRIGWLDSSSSEHPDTGDNSFAGTGVLNLNKPSIQYITTPDLERYSKDVIAAKEASQPLPDYNNYLTTLNINPGKIIINADAEHYYGDVNLYGGTLEFASGYSTTFFNGASHFNVLGDSVINLTSTASIFYNHLASHLTNLSIADDTTLTLKTALTYNGGGVPYYNTFDADNVQIGNNAKIHWVLAGSAADKTSVVIPITTTLGEYADVSIAENAVTTSVFYSVNKTGSQIDVAIADAAPWGPTVSYDNMTLKQAANNDADNKTFSIGYKIHKTGQPYLTFGGNIGEVVNNLAVNGNYRSDITYDLTVSAENPDGDNYSGFVLNSDTASLKMTNQQWADFKDFAVQANKGTLKLNNSDFTNTDGSTLILDIDNANVETYNLKFTNNTDAAIQINTAVNNAEYTISSINKNTEFANNNGAIKFNTDKDVSLNLNATEGSSLNFLTSTDTIDMGTGANSQINVNKGGFTYYDEKTSSYVTPEMNGDIAINSKLDNVNLNIHNGTISLGKAGHTFNTLNVLKDTTISLLDNKADTVDINTLNGEFKIDLLVDAIKGSEGYETDVINLANAPDNTNINVYAINIVSDDDTVDLQLINDNDDSSNVTYTTDATTYLGSYKYVFTADDTVKGLFHGTKSTSGVIDFYTLFTEESGGTHQLPFARTYSVDKDITVKGGVMAQDTVFNLMGNNYSFTLGVNGKEYRYLEATKGSTLNVYNIGKFTKNVDAEGNVTVTIDHEGLKNFRPQYSSGYYADHFADGDAGSVINIDGLVAHDIYTGTYKDDSIAHLIDSDGGDITIKNSLFSDLHFKGYESAYPSVVIRSRLDGNLTIENSIFENNEVKNGYNNGFIFIQSSSSIGKYGQLTINDSIFRNITSNDFNAVINNQRIFSVISDSLFENNGSTVTRSSDASNNYYSFWGPVTLATAEIHNSMFKGNYVNSTYDYDKVQTSFVRGGAIDAEGWIKIWDSSFIGNYAKSKYQNPSGGALYGLGDVLVYGSLMSNGDPLDPADLLTTDISTVTSTSTFKDNYVSSADTNSAYGGAVRGNYDVLFDGTVFEDNYAQSKFRVYGGAVYATKNAVVQNSVFKNNYVKNEYDKELTYSNIYLQAYGGAIATTMTTDTSYDYSMLIDNSIFDNNKIESARIYSYGGAVLYGEVSNSNLIKNSVFTNNSNTLTTTEDDTIAQAYGGAVYTKYMVFENDRFINNTVTASGSTSDKAYGGAIYASKKILVDDSYFEGNKAISDYNAYGGAIYAASNIDSKNSTFIGNKAISDDERYGVGGAVYTAMNTSSFDNATFTSNEASKNGGAINAGSGLTITGSSFTTNTAGGSGGAILGYNGSVDNSTFTGNTAGDNGGAIYTSNLAITNSLFTENTAVNEAGAVYSAENITGSTFTKNKATSENGSGGAITGYSSNYVTGSHFGLSDDSTSGNTAAYGGAARFYREKYGYGGTSVIKNSDFNFNSASKMGGAIYLAGGHSDSDYIDYDWHYDEEKQEWVRDYLGVKTSSSENELVVIDSAFNNNTTAGVDGLGKGAITVHGGNLKLAAVENDLTFTGNGTALSVLSTYSDEVTDNPDEPSRPLHTIIYGGVVNLNAADGHKIVFNDKIDSGVIAGDTPENRDRAILNINQAINYESGYDEETGEYIYTDLHTTGRVVLNADMTGYHGAVNQYGGTLALGSAETANMLTNASSFSVLGDSSIDLQNSKVDNVVFANPVTVNGALSLALDINGSEYSADLFGGELADGSTSTITISAINMLNKLSESHDFTISSGSLAQNITLATADALIVTGGGNYEFSYLNGVLTVNVLTPTYSGTLIDALQNKTIDDIPAPNEYTLNTKFTATENFGNLTGEAREFTIDGNAKEIDGDSHTGIKVSAGQTLNLNNIDSFNGTSDYAVENAGTVNVDGVTFKNNTIADIKNTGTLNFTNAMNTVTTIVDNGTETPEGVINITGGTLLTDGESSITQKTIYLKGGNLSTPNINRPVNANIVADETVEITGWFENGADVNGTVSGTFKGNTINSAIYNYGTIGNLTADFIGNQISNDSSANGGALKNESKISSISGNFTNNLVASANSNANGGAIYNSGEIGYYQEVYNEYLGENENKMTGGGILSSSTFIGNTAVSGGAIYNNGTINIVSSDFDKNSAANGGAVYNNATIGIDNGYGYVTEGGFTDASFTGNTADNYGGAIYNSASAKALLITAKTKDILFSGNAAANGASIYNLSTDGTSITADGGNVTFTDNIPRETDGYGIYSAASVNFSAKEGYKVTIDDSINIVNQWADVTVNQGDYTGTVELNGKINFENTNSGIRVGYAGFDSGTLKLGKTPANDTYQYIVNAGNYVLDLQNENAGDNLIVGTLTGASEMKLNVDYDATANSMDKITVNSGSGIITLNAVNIINDNESFVAGTKTEYLDGAARDNMTVITSSINAATDTGFIYVFTPTAIKGELSALRRMAYEGDLINAINDDLGGTVHPDSYSLSGDFTADRNFGNLSTENREQFTIFGNSHTVSGADTYTGINVSEGQTLNIDNVVFSKVLSYDVQNSGTLNFTGGNSINNITDAATPKGVMNITGGTTELARYGSIAQKEINLKGGRFVVNKDTNINTEIKADINNHVDYEVSGSSMAGVLNNAGTLSAISGTFKDNSFTAGQIARGGVIYNGGIINSVNADFTDNTMIATSEGYGGAIYNSGTIKSISGNFTNNTNGKTAEQYTNAHRGGAIYNISNGVIGNRVGEEFVGDAISGVFTGNIAGLGGAIFNGYDYYDPNAEIGNITANFDNNKAMAGQGGAIFNGRKIASISGTYTNNSASNRNEAFGGAIYTSGAITNGINNSTFTGNSVTSTNSNAHGGAIYQKGETLTISNSTFGGPGEGQGNSAIAPSGYAYGGAIYTELGTLNIVDSSFIGNIAKDGAAIYGWNSNVTINAQKSNVEFANNNSTGDASGTGTGIDINGGSLTLNADAGHNLTINDTVSSTTGMTINNGHNGTVALNGALTLGNALNVNGGTLTLNDTAAASLANTNLTLNGGSLKLDNAAAVEIVNTDLHLNGGTFDIAN
nr:hypothetical protein [Candidatus Gastranaerophilales bacterium]